MNREEALKQYAIDKNLRGADLRGANLRDANLWGADLRGANLYGCQGGPLQIHGSKHTLTFTCPQNIRIGCHTKTIGEWQRHYKAIGKAEGYTSAQIVECGEYIRLLARLEKAKR